MPIKDLYIYEKMTSKASTPEAEAVLNHGSGESGNESRSNFENSRQNLEESQPTEEDLCLPINNGSNLLSKNKNSTSDNSLTKGSVGLLRNEKDSEIYYSENNDYSLPNSKKSKNKLSFVGKTGGGRRKNYDRSNWECENKIREKFGLTHSGFLAGLFLICVAALLLIVVIVLSATWPQIPHRQKFPICVKSTCLRSSALVSIHKPVAKLSTFITP